MNVNIIFRSARLPFYYFTSVRLCTTQEGTTYKKPSILKRIWNSWIPIPTGVGLTLLAALQWRRLEKQRNQDLIVAKKWEVTCYKAIPLRSFSRFFGWVANIYIPEFMRPFVFNTYSRIFGVNCNEMDRPFTDYPCLCSFFTRKLKEGCRPIDRQLVVSPADGKVLNIGQLQCFNIDQVKGVTYNIKSFLGDITWSPQKNQNRNVLNTNRGDLNEPCESWSDYKAQLIHHPGNELYQCIVYLAPGDYHRFHSPVDWRVNFRRHFQGELLSVNPRMAKWIPDLFTLNERAVYVGTWQHGYFSMTAVGATNVGSIRVYDDETLHTNKRWKRGQTHEDLIMSTTWSKGSEVGEFRMGSTIVLIFEAPPDFRLCWRPGQSVLVGEAVCRQGDGRGSA